ncbi:helix-turn-helix transcriptional regulator [Nonlabens ulvanivorans]|uniref:helix-turn-helix transcriptional regulator n=1 Tax=Nonlabens ulvanivorans TaxID=906888 RepID=UPI003266B0F5
MKNTVHVQRAIHQMNQTELAQAIGVSRQTISSIEKNRYIPSTVLALKMARLFKVPVEDIFILEESDE